MITENGRRVIEVVATNKNSLTLPLNNSSSLLTNKDTVGRVYPEANKKIGLSLINRLEEVFSTLGYLVQVFPIEANGVDMVLYEGKYGRRTHVSEVLDWRSTNYLSYKRLSRIISNLKRYTDGERRLLIVSFFNPIDLSWTYDRCEEENIEVIELGFQINPYYRDFKPGERNAYGMIPDNEEAYRRLHQKLIEQLQPEQTETAGDPEGQKDPETEVVYKRYVIILQDQRMNSHQDGFDLFLDVRRMKGGG